jgi:hypothetical protein
MDLPHRIFPMLVAPTTPPTIAIAIIIEIEIEVVLKMSPR